jgi:hypothetical protein
LKRPSCADAGIALKIKITPGRIKVKAHIN